MSNIFCKNFKISIYLCYKHTNNTFGRYINIIYHKIKTKNFKKKISKMTTNTIKIYSK